MGLSERRATKEFQDSAFPKLKTELISAIGTEVEIEVAWDKLAENESAHLYAESWPKVYFQPAIEAFKSVCRDEMGKEAVKGALKKIVITNSVDNYNSDNWAKFSNGIVTLDHKPCTNIDYVDDRAKSLVSVLEKNL
jgi:hypothetical protein